MKIRVGASLLIAAGAWSVAYVAPALAETSSDFSNSKIVIGGYQSKTSKGEPLSKELEEVRQRMMQRRVLEEFAEFLSPLRLPYTLTLYASDCDGDANAYYTGPRWRAIMICYPIFASFEKEADYLVQLQKTRQLWTPVSREQYVAGVMAGVMLHEAGHALFDIMDVPIFGRQEDAADQMAGFIALQFNKETARTVIKGFAYVWQLAAEGGTDPPITPPDPNDPNYPKEPTTQCWLDPLCAYSDEHGTASQRVYNALCLAYGGDQADFQDLVDSGWLPETRAKTCEVEYRQAKFAFEKTVLPAINQEQMKKVQAKRWFYPLETPDRSPRQ